MQDKKIIREQNKKIRATLAKSGALQVISEKIVEKIKKEECFLLSKNIMIYHPKVGEVDLLPLLDCDNKKFYLPRCKGDDIEICHFEKGNELVCNKFNIHEPTGEAICDLSAIDVIFIPAIAADLFGARVGHGFGFYDRFLKNPSISAKKVVVLPKELLCEKICIDVFDVKYDMLVTD